MYTDTSWTYARHAYDPGAGGACRSGWVNDSGQWVRCRSSQASSVLHYNEDAEERERHWHEGGDCMCYEGGE